MVVARVSGNVGAADLAAQPRERVFLLRFLLPTFLYRLAPLFGFFLFSSGLDGQLFRRGLVGDAAEMVEIVGLALQGNSYATFYGQDVDPALKP